MVVVAAVVALAVMFGGVGLWAWHNAAADNNPGLSAATVGGASPSPATSASPSPAAALPLTAQLSGDYCPVAHRGDAACWQGSVVNTGPPIGQLAFMFVLGAPYSNWFATHSNSALSGFYTTPGCAIDAANARIVCGPLRPYQEIDVYLGGDTSARGTFNFAVKFADISSGSPVYINQHPDGTHDIVTWREVVA